MTPPEPVTVQLGARPHDAMTRPVSDREVAARTDFGVTLVNMPFASPDRPSLAMGLLTAIAAEEGYRVASINANLDFARLVGYATAHELSNHRGHQVGDWIFARAAFGESAPAIHDRFVQDFAPQLAEIRADIAERLGHDLHPEWLERLPKRIVPEFIDGLVAAHDWSSVQVVGFTSTFQQTTASIALATALKAAHPHLTCVFGGANFDEGMGPELVRTIEAIDYAVIGEGDEAFPRMLRSLALGLDPVGIPGVVARRDGKVVGTAAEPVTDLRQSPIPDYDDFFERSRHHGFLPDPSPMAVRVPFETSRGCWWGEKSHCTFCGLNGSTMEHRRKPAELVRRQLGEMAERYGSFRLEATDNIMAREYFDELLPALADDGHDYEIFFELKANLGRDDVERLSRAGIRGALPGIESLSSRVLGLMRKGVRSITNVNMLRWATHHDMWTEWNVIYGFPGETQSDYDEQADLMPSLHHLQPPRSIQRIWLERYSPLYSNSDLYPVTYKKPERSYEYVFPAGVDLEQVAYFFDYEFEDHLDDDSYDRCRDEIHAWHLARLEGGSKLELWRAPGMISIEDTRHGRNKTWTFNGAVADLYLSVFEEPRSVRHLVEADVVPGLSAADVEQVLDAFVERRLMMRDGNLFLALALPHSRPR